MGRPKKKDKLHSTSRHVVKVKIGTNIDDTPRNVTDSKNSTTNKMEVIVCSLKMYFYFLK